MRILTLRLSTQDGKLSSEASLVIDDKDHVDQFLLNLGRTLELVNHKLDTLEKQAPSPDAQILERNFNHWGEIVKTAHQGDS